MGAPADSWAGLVFEGRGLTGITTGHRELRNYVKAAGTKVARFRGTVTGGDEEWSMCIIDLEPGGRVVVPLVRARVTAHAARQIDRGVVVPRERTLASRIRANFKGSA